MGAFRSARNACASNALQAPRSYFVSTPQAIIPFWRPRPTPKKNPNSFSPIAQNEECPGLLTTKMSWFENSATQGEKAFAALGLAAEDADGLIGPEVLDEPGELSWSR